MTTLLGNIILNTYSKVLISPDKIFNILPIFAYLKEYEFNSINLI